MRHAISVGMGFGKTSFDDAVIKAEEGDVVVIDPGEYKSVDGVQCGTLEIHGAGQSPTDVVIYTEFDVKEGGMLKLQNVTLINTKPKSNVVYVDKGGQMIATSVAFYNRVAADYPVVYVSGTVSLTACELAHETRYANDGLAGTGLYLVDGAYGLISQCDIVDIDVNGSKLDAQRNQIHENIHLEDNSEFNADTLYLTDRRRNYFMISASNGSVLQVDELVVLEGQSDANVDHSRMRVTRSNIDPLHTLNILVEDDADVDVPGAAISQPQVATSNGTPEEQPAQAEPPADDKPVETPAAPPAKAPSAPAQPPAEKPAIDQLHEMIGLTKLKKQVDTFIKVASFNQKRAAQGSKATAQSLHSLFLGNPGTGKTTVARLVGKIMYENGVLPSNNYVEVSREDLVSQNVGGTAVQTKKVLESATGGVLFIDEAYTLYQEGGSVNWGQEAIDTILKYMEDHRDDLMIIFAGYTKQMQDFMNMNPGLTSRAPNVFEFEDYTPAEIAQIGLMDLHRQDYKVDKDHYTQAVTKAFIGNVDHSNGRWVRNYNEKLIQTFVVSLPEDSQNLFTIPNSIIDQLAGGDRQEKAAAVDALLGQLNGMVGLNSVKAFVNDLVKQVKVDQALQDKLPDATKPTYHMVFAGPPGTGKTTVARLIAQLFYNLGILPKDTVSEVARPDLVGQYIGQTAQKTGKAIRDAMGGVLFVDEAYQLSQGSENDFGKEAIETFITELENNRDKFIAIFAGYTNDMNDFLEANPGLRSRVPLTLEFEAYTPDEIAQIVENIVTKHWTINTELLHTVVVKNYKQLPANKQSNGRWARNFADKLISQHKLWLADHLDKEPNLDVHHISDALLVDSSSWS